MNTVIPSLSSAKAFISLLDENSLDVKAAAIESLLSIVECHWPEIADALDKLEILYEDKGFSAFPRAGLLVSMVYFHLGDLNEALNFTNFDYLLSHQNSDYATTLIAVAIDKYASASSSGEVSMELSSFVETILNSESCLKSVIGISLEGRNLVRLGQILNVDPKLLDYARVSARKTKLDTEFRHDLYDLFISILEKDPVKNAVLLADILIETENAIGLCKLFTGLLKDSGEKETDALLLAYQIAFNVCWRFPTSASQITESIQASNSLGDNAKKSISKILSGELLRKLFLSLLAKNNAADFGILSSAKANLSSKSSMSISGMSLCHGIMMAGTSCDTYLRQPVLMEFLAGANNWSKFTATACLGLIHARQTAESAFTLLSQYLPNIGNTNGVSASKSPYSEGGSLFALGLIGAGRKEASVQEKLMKSLESPSEVVQHGAALGIGAAALGFGDFAIVESLKSVLYADSAVAGEGASIAIGLVLLGNGIIGNEKVKELNEELLSYAHETQHNKIIRGIGLSLGLLSAQCGSSAMTTIDALLSDKNAVLRYGGAFALALAFNSTADFENNIKGPFSRLLGIAVSDTSDDVRRAAALSIGLLFCGSSAAFLLPDLVALLAESYNPHVRYGIALALGMCLSGTGDRKAVSILQPILVDRVDFVRQGAMIALSMVFQQIGGSSQGSAGQGYGAASFRKHVATVLSDKHSDAISRFGALLATGIIDAGGRNSAFNVVSPCTKRQLAGLALFCNYWYWYPLTAFIGLSLEPTALIALDQTLKLPKVEFVCKAKPSVFAYPKLPSTKASSSNEKLVTAVLSTTAKVAARNNKKKVSVSGAEMMITGGESEKTKSSEDSSQVDLMDTTSTATAPTTNTNTTGATSLISFQVENFKRVTTAQRNFIELVNDHFVPIVTPGDSNNLFSSCASGVIILKNTSDNNSTIEYLETTEPSSSKDIDAKNESTQQKVNDNSDTNMMDVVSSTEGAGDSLPVKIHKKEDEQ